MFRQENDWCDSPAPSPHAAIGSHITWWLIGANKCMMAGDWSHSNMVADWCKCMMAADWSQAAHTSFTLQ